MYVTSPCHPFETCRSPSRAQVYLGPRPRGRDFPEEGSCTGRDSVPRERSGVSLFPSMRVNEPRVVSVWVGDLARKRRPNSLTAAGHGTSELQPRVRGLTWERMEGSLKSPRGSRDFPELSWTRNFSC